MNRIKEFAIGMIGLIFIVVSYHIPEGYNLLLLGLGSGIVGWGLTHEKTK
jgi:hypothetical protein